MKEYIIKQIIRVAGMIIIGVSVLSYKDIGLWFLIPWVIGWNIYDLNTKLNIKEQ